MGGMPANGAAIVEAKDIQDEEAPERHVHPDGSHEAHSIPRLTCIPLRHTKIVHLIRHGQGFHNVAGHADPALYRSWDYYDAHLTDLGWKQVLMHSHLCCCQHTSLPTSPTSREGNRLAKGAPAPQTSACTIHADVPPNLQALALRQHMQRLGSAFRMDLIVVSPLTRTLETAAGVFGCPREPTHTQPLFMHAQSAVADKRAAQAAISTPANCPPILAVEACREHLGAHPCDKRRRISHIACAFPAVDFTLVGWVGG